MIDGLKLTMTGEELRTLIEARVAEHHARAAHWQKEAAHAQSNEAIQVPEHICENEAALSEWRAERLTFLRDHLDPSEVYRLGETDLEFADLLREEPELFGPDFSDDLEPYTKRVCDSPEIVEVLNPDHPA